MSFVNTTKPSGSITNMSKVSIGETWGSITTSWASETRTWQMASQLFANVSKVVSTIVNTIKPS